MDRVTDSFLHALCRDDRNAVSRHISQNKLDIDVWQKPFWQIICEMPNEEVRDTFHLNHKGLSPLDTFLIHYAKLSSSCSAYSNENFGERYAEVFEKFQEAKCSSSASSLVYLGILYSVDSMIGEQSLRSYIKFLLWDSAITEGAIVNSLSSLLREMLISQQVIATDVSAPRFTDLISTLLNMDCDTVNMRLERLAAYCSCLCSICATGKFTSCLVNGNPSATHSADGMKMEPAEDGALQIDMGDEDSESKDAAGSEDSKPQSNASKISNGHHGPNLVEYEKHRGWLKGLLVALNVKYLTKQRKMNEFLAFRVIGAFLPLIESLLREVKPEIETAIFFLESAVQINDLRILKVVLAWAPPFTNIDWEGRKSLLAYCQSAACLELLLRQDLDVNHRSENGLTPLMESLLYFQEVFNTPEDSIRFIPVWETIISHPQFDACAADEQGKTILMYLLRVNVGVFSLSRRIIDRAGLDVNAKDESGICALGLSWNTTKLSVFDYLLSRVNIDPNVVVGDGEHLMHSMISFLGSHGHHERGSTPFSGDAPSDHDRVLGNTSSTNYVRLLLSKLISHSNIDLSIKSKAGKTPLLHAVFCSLYELATAILSHENIDINVADPETGSTALHFAVKHKRQDMIKRLLARDDIDPNVKDNGGTAPIFYTISPVKSLECLKLLWNHPKLDINSELPEGHTPLILAFNQGHYDLVNLLLSREDINVNVPDPLTGETLLHLAMQRTHKGKPIGSNFFERLLNKKSLNPNIKDKEGNTPIFYGIHTLRSDQLLMLCEHEKSDITIPNKYHQTVEDVLNDMRPEARDNRKVAIIKHAMKKKSAEGGNLSSSEILEMLKSNVNQADLDEELKESLRCHTQVMEDILQKAADMQKRDNSSKGPSWLARHRIFLCDEMSPYELFTHLAQRNVLNSDEVEEIRSAGSRRRMCEKILDVVATQNENVQREFLSALTDSGQDHIAKHIKQAEGIEAAE